MRERGACVEDLSSDVTQRRPSRVMLIAATVVSAKDADILRIVEPGGVRVLDGPPGGLSLSPDGTAIVYNMGVSGETRLVPLAEAAPEFVIARRTASPAIAWSNDSKFVALRGLFGLKLFSAKGVELAALENHLFGCSLPTLASVSRSVTFDSESTSVWLSCLVDAAGDSYLAAVELSVPNLRLVKKIRLPAPLSGRRNTAFATEIRLDPIKGHVILSQVIHSSMPSNRRSFERFYIGFNVTEGANLFSPLECVGRQPHHIPLQFVVRGARGIASWMGSDLPFESFNVHEPSNAVRFGGPKSLPEYRPGLQFLVSPNATHMFMAMRHKQNTTGAIVAIDPRTGLLDQAVRLEREPRLFLQSGGRILVVALGKQLTYYVVN